MAAIGSGHHFRNTPRDRYPLLLFYHPLNINWKQVIKQADVVLAMFLLGDIDARSEIGLDRVEYAPREGERLVIRHEMEEVKLPRENPLVVRPVSRR
jgi:hypothetical protein